jgi:hypothetical protein
VAVSFVPSLVVFSSETQRRGGYCVAVTVLFSSRFFLVHRIGRVFFLDR